MPGSQAAPPVAPLHVGLRRAAEAPQCTGAGSPQEECDAGERWWKVLDPPPHPVTTQHLVHCAVCVCL